MVCFGYAFKILSSLPVVTASKPSYDLSE